MKLVAGSYERFLWGWQVRTKTSELHLAFSFPAHRGPVKSIAACGSLVATGGSDDTINVYDVNEGKDMGSLFGHTGGVTCLDFFKPENSSLNLRPTHLFSGSEDGTLSIWDTDSWSHLKSMKGHKTALKSLTVHPSGKVALSVERDGHLKMWNLFNARCTFTIKLASEASLIKFSPQTGETYAVVRDETLEISNVESGSLLHSLQHEKRILCLAQNQDGLIFTGGEESIIRAWDTRSGKLTCSVPNAHTNRIRGLCTLNSPESAELPYLIASASSDGSVRVWDIRVNQSLEDKASTAPAFETKTNARLTCLVSCGSAKKLETITLTNSQHGDATQKVSNGADESSLGNNGVATKAAKEGGKKRVSNGADKDVVVSYGVASKATKGGRKQDKKAVKQSRVQVQEAPSQGKKKRKKHHAKST